MNRSHLLQMRTMILGERKLISSGVSRLRPRQGFHLRMQPIVEFNTVRSIRETLRVGVETQFGPERDQFSVDSINLGPNMKSLFPDLLERPHPFSMFG